MPLSLKIPPVESIFIDPLSNVQVDVLRTELIHPYIQGNKWYKLKYNLAEAKAQKLDTILTFGGAFSNHIYATAAAGKEFGLKTIGVIRGEETSPLNETLTFATSQGMRLEFISRTAYRMKTDPIFIEELRHQFGAFYLIPEGGTNRYAIEGCVEMISTDQYEYYDYILCACGTGGTIAGIITASQNRCQILGVSVLKGAFIKQEVDRLLNEVCAEQTSTFQIVDQYHQGGYAKVSSELSAFVQEFNRGHTMQLEPIYTGKLFYAVFDLLKQNFFSANSKVLVVHSGGLRGPINS